MLQNIMLVRNIRTRALYHDRVDPTDMSNRCFVIYHLSRYNNRPHFLYCDTNDDVSIEFKLRSTVPVYHRVCMLPISHNAARLQMFEEYIHTHKTQLCILPDENVFSLDDDTCIADVMRVVTELFPAHTSHD
jgi:hypothetical protein